MRPVDAELRNILETFSAMFRDRPSSLKLKHPTLYDAFLSFGSVFPHEPYTPEERELLTDIFKGSRKSWQIKQCFYNAQSFAQMEHRLEYAEGYLVRPNMPILIEHAWNVLPGGKPVDVTIREMGERATCDPKKLLVRASRNLENAYFGVIIPAEEIRKWWVRTGRAEAMMFIPDVQRQILKEGFPEAWRGPGPSLSGLMDIPMPPDQPRPEMWSPEDIVQAVADGFTFLIPFIVGESMFAQNAYWIRGIQVSASALTVGPEHTPEIGLLPDRWIWVHTFFRPEMVPKDTWIGEPNENGVVKVRLEVDPETVDWEWLNRGRQIRVER